MRLDDLDERLLEHFETWFPRPETLEFCEFDSSAESVSRLCREPDLYEDAGLLRHFVSGVRLGMVGDWRDFPPFAGVVAVFSRRESLLSEHDWAPLYLHASPAGAFGQAERDLLREWCEDLLLPWRREVEREAYLDLPEHALDALGLYALLGGEPFRAIEANLGRLTEGPTALLTALYEFTGPRGVEANRVRVHFAGMRESFQNQELPELREDLSAPVDKVLSALDMLG